MGIIARTVQIIRSNLNALLDRAEDPTKLIDQTLKDMQSAYQRAKEQVAQSIADLKRLEQAANKEREQIELYQRRAAQAIQQEKEDLAREALQRKQEHTLLHQQYGQEVQHQREQVELLKSSLRELDQKIDAFKRKKNLLISKHRGAKARDAVHGTLESIRSEGALDTMQRMEERIEEISHRSHARAELTQELEGETLDQRLKSLDAPNDVEDELLALKNQLKLPAPDSSR